MKNNKLVLKGVFSQFPKYNKNGSRIYDEKVFKSEVEKMTLNAEVKPRIESAMKGGYIDKILDMIDEELIDNYIRRKKIERIQKKI